MLVKALSRKLLGYFVTLLFIVTVAGCGGGGGSSTGNTPESPIAGNETLIEARTAGGIRASALSSTVTLDGTKSFISSNSPSFTSSNVDLSYNWEFTHIPEGSSAILQNATSATPSFTADVLGDYIVQLIVTAQGYTSKRTVQSILVYDPSVSPSLWYGKYPGHLGLSSNCIECHAGDKIHTNGKLIKGKHETHIASSSACESCHTIKGFDIAVKTDHGEVFGNCSVCHNNVKAIGKSEFHSVTDSECDACHNTVSFLTLEADGSYNHSNITRACQGCHNGKVARGKHEAHENTTQDCGFCHTTVDFKNAFPDHTDPDGIVFGKRCYSCHNDDPVNGIGKSSTGFHPNDMSIAQDMSLDCDVCHSITAFNMGGFFNHSLVDITLDPQEPACYKCHNDSSTNIGATQMPNDTNHQSLSTNLDCYLCHTTETFVGATNFDHSGLDPSKRCDDCHGNSAAVSPDVPAIGIPAPSSTFVHVNTNGADCGACHTPGTFKTGVFDHSTVDMATTSCVSCHDGLISTGLSDFEDHIPLDSTSPADCDVCHTTTTYESFATPVVMTHTDPGVDITVCSACHDGVKSSGKSVGHVPTRSLDCGDCHVNTSNYTDFTLSPWDHAAIGAGSDTDCASCHDAGYATPKSTTHIPSVAECSVCHTDTSVGGFATNNFRSAVHDSLTTGCEGCHVSKFFPDALDVNKFKASSHLPTAQDCHFCHSAAATDFMDVSKFNHDGITSNCSSCHNGATNNFNAGAVGEPGDTIHSSISADCSICHTTSKAWLDGAYVDHTSPDVLKVRCDNCHSGAFTSNTPPAPVIKGKNFISNHPVTSSDCVVCHASDPAIDFKDGGVDHTSAAVKAQRCDNCHGSTATGLSSNHVPIGSDDCGSCHIGGGSFKPSTFDHVGITDNCTSCHDGSYKDSGALGKADAPTTHVTTTAECNACHNTDKFAGAKFDHSTVTTSTRCDTCHNGTVAQGKEPPLGHVPTNQDCRQCHQTTGFIPGTFDHSQNSSTARCDSCHGAGYATPKSAGHIKTTQDCKVCHSGFVSFVGGTFDHSGVTSSTRCDSCHDGVTAKGKADAVPAHITTSLDCRSCHTTGTFVGGTWTHDSSSAGNCTNCHDNGGGATEQSLTHITTSIQCDECHTTSAWTFKHKSPYGAKDSNGYFTMGNYPGDHSTWKIPKNRCDLCHTSGFTTSVLPINNANFTWNEAPSLAPTCAACHQSEAREEHGNITSVTNRYANCLVGCHEHSITKTKW